MLRRRELTLRCRLEAGETRGFPAIEELRDADQTDYLAIVYRIRHAMRVEDVDAFYARWTTARPGGFSDEEVGVLSRLTPLLGLAVRSAAQTRLTKTLVEAYLGQGPGRQVLSGGIRHGSVKRINAVLWFSDITGYTNLSESVQNDQLVPLINDYAEAVIGAVKGAGGDVLKLIGDGVLAIFTSSRPEYSCRAAVEAERDMRTRLLRLAKRRENAGLSVADIHLGLHAGRVFYGNIGTPDRLDFTVVGQPVNEVSRISSMCESAGRNMLCSSEFAELLLGEERGGAVGFALDEQSLQRLPLPGEYDGAFEPNKVLAFYLPYVLMGGLALWLAVAVATRAPLRLWAAFPLALAGLGYLLARVAGLPHSLVLTN
jgi:adenylate cyclase